MAGVLISDYAVDTAKWTELLETLEKQRKGYIGLSLTNYDNSSLPAIEAASYLECAGALYGFASEEAIGGSPTTANINYIIFDPTPITLVWSIVAPTWSPSKNGWYDAGEAKRYIGGCYYVDTPTYTDKWIYGDARDIDSFIDGNKYQRVHGDYVDANGYIDTIEEQGSNAKLRCKIIEIGTWNMDTTVSVNIAHGLTAGNIRTVMAVIRKDDDSAMYPMDFCTGTTNEGWYTWDATNIILGKIIGGYFDGTLFDTMGDDGNRGWITIWYEV